MHTATAEPDREPSIAARLVPRAVAREYCISESSIVIGSSESADVRDTDASVQPQHARLSNEDGRWYVEDLDSATGTFLNGRRIDRRAHVEHGDAVRCGTSALELTCELVARAGAQPLHDGLIHEVEQLRERVVALETEHAEREARIGELIAEAEKLNASLRSVRHELAHAREERTATVAELEHEIARERAELDEAARLDATRLHELDESKASIAELRQIIDAQQATPDQSCAP